MAFVNRLMRISAAMALVVASFAASVGSADARSGNGGSIGSRGTKTFSSPPATNTAPGSAAPINRSITQPGSSASAATSTAAAQQGSRFGGLKGLLLGGLIGAGLASLLGAGALASVLGFVLQMALIAGIVMLVVAFFRSRAAQPAMATAQSGSSRPGTGQNAYRVAPGVGGAAPAATLAQSDFDRFEWLLGEVQTAYGLNDSDRLGELVTPEMLSYFAQDLDANAKKGLINEISDVKLLQGDLAETWHEPGSEFATVAMRYSLIDAMVESRSGRVVSGSKTQPQEATEVWTFRRPVGGTSAQWELSAIQQTN